jgi:hypothetical protein
MPRRGQGRITGQPITTAIPLPAGGVKLVTFIPWTLVKRGMKKEIITPLDAPEAFREEAAAEGQAKQAEQPSPLVRALGLAHYWQWLLDKGHYQSIKEIAEAEGVDRGYASRIAQLSRLAPDLLEISLAGKEGVPPLERLIRQGLPTAWEEQRKIWAQA